MNKEMVTLGAITENNVEKCGPTGEAFTYVDISSIDREKKIISEPKILATADAPSRARQVLQAGDVLVSMTRPNLNAVAMVTPELHGAIGSTGFHVLRSQKTLPKFLFYLVQTNGFIDEMCKFVQGALYPAVRPKDISSFEFFLPSSLEEQQSIVAAIDTQFSRLDEAVTALKRIQANLKRYKAAVLKAAVEGKLTEQWRRRGALHAPLCNDVATSGRTQCAPTETGAYLLKRILTERRAKWEAEELAKMKTKGIKPKDDSWKKKYKEPAGPETTNLPELPEGWVWVRLGSLRVDVFDGPFGSNLKSTDYVSSGVRVIRLENIGSREFIDGKESFVTEQKYEQLKKHTVGHGDIIFSSFVANDTRVVMLPSHIKKAINKADCFCVRINGEAINKRYIETFLATRTAYEQLVGEVHGATRPRINTTQLKDCHVSLPPLAEQNEIVSELDRRLSVTEELEVTIETNLSRAERLRQMILQQSFSYKSVGGSYGN